MTIYDILTKVKDACLPYLSEELRRIQQSIEIPNGTINFSIKHHLTRPSYQDNEYNEGYESDLIVEYISVELYDENEEFDPESTEIINEALEAYKGKLL